MSEMEVDSPDPEASGTTQHLILQEKTLKLHPLAIIGISDHHTRVSVGGSALPSSSPTIGLLFGYQQNRIISIIDAEEVETSSNTSALDDKQKNHIRTKIELHQKVFPTHEVVGWYKVSAQTPTQTNQKDVDVDVLPTPEDLSIHNGWMKEFNESPIYVLMDASEKTNHSKSSSNTDGEEARQKLDRDEELPFTVYETMMVENAQSIFVNLDFDLETFEPERIAVEKVFNTQPTRAVVNAVASPPPLTTTTTTTAAANQTKSNMDSVSKPKSHAIQSTSTSPTLVKPTAAELHLQSAIASIDGMNARIAILLDFLRKTQEKTIPVNHTLLRQVMSLVKQLPLVTGKYESRDSNNIRQTDHKNDVRTQEFENEFDDMLVVSYLATLAKTTKAVLGYSEKFGVITETNSNRRGGDFIGGPMFHE